MQKGGASGDAIHSQQAALASLASVASGNGVFVACEAARLSSPAAVGLRDAAVEPDNAVEEKAALQESTPALADVQISREAENINISHPSTPSPTEETAVQQEVAAAEVLPAMLPEAARDAAEALRQGAEEAAESQHKQAVETTEAEQEAAEAEQAAADEEQAAADEEQAAAEALYIATVESSSLTDTALQIAAVTEALADKPNARALATLLMEEQLNLEERRAEAEEPVRTPKRMCTETGDLRQNPSEHPAEPDQMEQTLGRAANMDFGRSSTAQQLAASNGGAAAENAREALSGSEAAPPLYNTLEAAAASGEERLREEVINAMSETEAARNSLQAAADLADRMQEQSAGDVPPTSIPEAAQQTVQAPSSVPHMTGQGEAVRAVAEITEPSNVGQELAPVLQQPVSRSLALVGFFS